jgi:hypothetical protein
MLDADGRTRLQGCAVEHARTSAGGGALMRGALLPIVGALALALLGGSALAQVGDEPDCTRTSSSTPPVVGAPLDRAVRLTSDPASEVVNFGSGRGQQSFDVVVTVEPPLPPQVRADQIALDAPRRFQRVSDRLDSARLPPPTFTEPRITTPQGDEITFTVCLRGADVRAGRYTGQVRVGGPLGVSRGSTVVTVNVKAKIGWFVGGVAVALLAAALLLFLQEWQSDKQTRFGRGFWIQSGIGLALAFGALYAVWNANPTWGDDGLTATLALIGTAVSAAGLRSFIDTLASR